MDRDEYLKTLNTILRDICWRRGCMAAHPLTDDELEHFLDDLQPVLMPPLPVQLRQHPEE